MQSLPMDQDRDRGRVHQELVCMHVLRLSFGVALGRLAFGPGSLLGLDMVRSLLNSIALFSVAG